MAVMGKPANFITPQTAAISKAIVTDCKVVISSVGTVAALEDILVQIPLQDSPDDANDSHWKTYTQMTVVQSLTNTNDSVTLDSGMLIRIKKPITVAAVGIRIS